MGYIQEIADIWKDEYPPSRPRPHSLIEKLSMTPVVFMRLISLDQIKPLLGESAGHVFMDSYVIFFTLLMTTALFIPSHWGWIGVALAVYRITDIVTYRMYFLLVKSQARPWTASTLRRSLVIVLLNFYETVVAYAVLYLTVGHVIGTTSSTQQQLGATTALYYSAVTATTLGYGDFIPGDDLTRVLAMAQLFTTILFLIFVIPALISVFSSNTTQ